MSGARLVFHLPARHLDDWREMRHLALFRRIAEAFQPRGLRLAVVDRRELPFQGGETRAYDDGDLHVLDTGRARGPGVLNASIAYLPPFWQLDPAGILAESGIGARVYDRVRGARRRRRPSSSGCASAIRWRGGRGGRRKRRSRTCRGGRSRSSCRATSRTGRGWPMRPGRDAGGGGHGRGRAAGAGQAASPGARPRRRGDRPRGQAGLPVTPTTANVADIIAASVATVSVNSACALEGFLQRKPAILFGPSDFHHFAHTVRAPGDFPAALAAALARPPGGYARFLHWFFVQNCLNVTAADLPARVEAIFAEVGFSAERLGMT